MSRAGRIRSAGSVVVNQRRVSCRWCTARRHPVERFGSASSSATAARSGLPIPSSGISGSVRTRRGPAARPSAARTAAGSRSRSGDDGRVDDDGRGDELSPLRVGQPDHAGRPHPGLGQQHPLDGGRGHLLAAGDDHVVEPAEHLQPAVARTGRGRRSGTSRRRTPTRSGRGGPDSRWPGSVRRARCRRPASSRTRTPSSGNPVVHAAARGLAHPVGGHHAHPGRVCARAPAAASSAAPPTSTAW